MPRPGGLASDIALSSLSAVGAVLGSFSVVWILGPNYGANTLYAMRFGLSFYYFNLPLLLIFMAVPGILAAWFYLEPGGRPWRLGSTEPQWAAFTVAFVASAGPILSYDGQAALGVWVDLLILLALLTLFATFAVRRVGAEGSRGATALPWGRILVLAGLSGGLVLSAAFVSRIVFESSRSGFFLFPLLGAVFVLFYLGIRTLKQSVLAERPATDAKPALARHAQGLLLLLLPLAISAAYTVYFTYKVATGDLTLPDPSGSPFAPPWQAPQLIPAAVAGWLALGCLVAIVFWDRPLIRRRAAPSR